MAESARVQPPTPSPLIPLGLFGCGPHPTQKPASLPNAPKRSRQDLLWQMRWAVFDSFTIYWLSVFMIKDTHKNLSTVNYVASSGNAPQLSCLSFQAHGCRVCASLVLQIICQGLLVCCRCHPAIQRAHKRSKNFARSKVMRTAIHGALWCWRQTHPARLRWLRPHYRDYHLHSLFHIQGCECQHWSTSLCLFSVFSVFFWKDNRWNLRK